MKKLLIFFLIISCIILVHSSPTKIDKKVLDQLENSPNARVIVELQEPSPEEGIFFKTQKTIEEIGLEEEQTKQEILGELQSQNIKHVFKKSLAIDASEAELKNLDTNPNVKSIKIDLPMKTLLEDSVPLTNASVVWPIQLSGINITGFNETVCVIDTGIDTNHPDLQNKIVGQYCFCSATEKPNSSCCADGTSRDTNAEDNNGHGTHVSGIVAASGSINGIAIGANIYAVKTLNSTGSGYSSDTAAAIGWCSNDTNIQLYNISVISISLGGGQYSSYCDSEDPSTTDAINTAVGKNISVIVATGNDGSTTKISLPSCIKNATAVGSTTKLDAVSSFSNRNAITDLFAPGGTSTGSASCSPGSMDPNRICSTYIGGGYIAYSGTSMSTPHVSGAFAIIRQFFRQQNKRIPTPVEIQNILNSTGKLIDDTSGSGYNFSRIDLYSALVSIDVSNPNVTLISPQDNTYNFSRNITFECSANDVLLSNITLYIWNSTALYNTTLAKANGTNAYVQFNLTDIPYGSYNWNCLAYDANNNFSFATANYTFISNRVNSVLNLPTDNTFTNQPNQTFNCSAETNSLADLSNMTLFIWNSTNLIYNLTQNISGISNFTLFNFSLSQETEYLWNCLVYNNESNSTFAINNNSLTYDISKPNITAVPDFPTSETSSSTSKIFYYNVTDNYNVNNCSLIINNAISLTNSSINLSRTNSFTQTFTAGTYVWQINCTDIAGNTANSSTNSFTITAPTVTTSTGGGGGGGGSSTVKTYTATQSQLSSGFTKSLNKNEKIKFNSPENILEDHTITLNYMGIDYAAITVQSDPINFVLYIGEEKKMNLTNAYYYDIYIKLNNIEDKKANLTVKSILEPIPKNYAPTQEQNTTKDEFEGTTGEIEQLQILRNRLIIILISFILLAVVLEKELKRRHKKKNESTKTKHEGK